MFQLSSAHTNDCVVSFWHVVLFHRWSNNSCLAIAMAVVGHNHYLVDSMECGDCYLHLDSLHLESSTIRGIPWRLDKKWRTGPNARIRQVSGRVAHSSKTVPHSSPVLACVRGGRAFDLQLVTAEHFV
jgi:hypothetical protein